MAYMSDYSSAPARRRTALRTVPPTPHYLAAEPAAHLAPAAEEQNFLETVRQLWRRRGRLAFRARVLGGAAVATAGPLPACYGSEARVLVGVQAPRLLPNVEAVMADISPDAERVQNEGFILQSRSIAKQVIDQLKLRDNPEFNPELRGPSFWSRLDLGKFVPPMVNGWVAHLLPGKPAKEIDASKEAASRDDRMIDLLLSRVDVSTLGRSHVLSIKADAQNPTTAAALANALAERYLDYQRRDKIESMDRVEKFLLGRITELREQVAKADQAVQDYRRSHDLYKSAGNGVNGMGVTAQQLSELNTQLLSAQTAKADSGPRFAETPKGSKGGLSNESVPEVLKSPLIAALKQQQADTERKAAQLSASYDPHHPSMVNARAEAGNIQERLRPHC